MHMTQADIGLIGLAVMGQNLVLNMNDHGYTVAVYNRTTSKVDEFLDGPAKGTKVIGAHSLKDLISQLKRPRRVMLMVKAGEPVDNFIEQCLPYLEKGDILIDGGNSLFTDTNRRCNSLKEKGIIFIGTGISGGEEGARHGPSIMPGGNPEGWPHIKEIFQSISAKVEGEPCCDWVGDQGAGHYVKMVHNGIEYGDMQLISEAYYLLKEALHLNQNELYQVFADWNKGDLDSYLIEITSKIFKVNDEDGKPLVDKILDVAGQKGTGKWTVINALDLGMPLTLIGEAVFARCLSALKDERVAASELLKGPDTKFEGNREEFIQAIREALYSSKIISYTQGFMLMQQAAAEYKWQLNYGAIALMWRGGCIIRSQFLGKIKEAFKLNPNLKSLLLDEYFLQEIQKRQKGWRKVVSKSVELGIATPCFNTALVFYDGYRTAKLPANLLQAQRDFFGAHTYERGDRARGQYFHTDWSGTGGKVSSGSYNA
ncbi:decarboxylating NADP(+)-dependent phosphogluconate dehydrogenase [Candidatus Protochlamydia sp. R18]|uniref:decarboxylating NADP(+)-dependent phosphogluconate dehydrogenase n=1 Tax=Candidatus Protochlamydia sp. R18 TaxID=1353977 RepID=UPI00403DABEB